MTEGVHPYTEDPSLFVLLYRECTGRLPSHPLHNPYINYYSSYTRDTSPIYTPSKLYVFCDMLAAVTCDTEHREGGGNQEEAPECAIAISRPDPSVAQSLLTACHTICQHQPVTDLWIEELECDDVTEADVFNMSRNTVSLVLDMCRLPAAVLNHLLHQMSGCTTVRTIDLQDTSLAGVTSLNLSNMAMSLTHLCLQSTEMSPELCESVCTQLPHLMHLQYINLTDNPLGDHGHHITELIRSWGPDPPLRELWLVGCKMPVDVWHQLLSALSTCKQLTCLYLTGNSLMGCLPNLVPDLHPGLHSLELLAVAHAALNRDDVQHMTWLIQTNKLPRLGYLWLAGNNLCVMEDVCGRLIEACVTHLCQGELRLYLGSNNLSEEFVRKWESHIETNTELDLGRTERHFRAYKSKRAVGRIELRFEEEEELGVSSYSKSIEPVKQTAIPTLAELAALSKYSYIVVSIFLHLRFKGSKCIMYLYGICALVLFRVL